MTNATSLSALTSALLLACALPAQADWRYVQAPPQQPATLSSIVTGQDGSLWTLSPAAVYRTDSSGRTVLIDRAAEATDLPQDAYRSSFPQSDGGMILLSANCRLLRLDAALNRSGPVTLPNCLNYSANATGSAWISDGTSVSRLRSDGVVLRTVQPDFGASRGRIAQLKTTGDGGVLVLTLTGENNRARLSRYRGDGSLQWNWSANTVPRFVEADDGSIYAYSHNAASDKLQLDHLDSSGRPLWSREHALYTDEVISLLPASDGAAYVVSGGRPFNRPMASHLMRVEAGGDVAWNRAICPEFFPQAQANLATVVSANGETATLCQDSRVQVLRRDRFGNTTTSTPLPLHGALDMQRRNDGTLVILGNDPAPSYQSRLLELDRNNQVRPAAGDRRQDYAAVRLLAQHSGSDGSSYLLSQPTSGANGSASQTLTRIGADGTRSWSRELASDQIEQAAMDMASGRICVNQSTYSSTANTAKLRSFCLDSGDGQTLWMRESSAPFSALPVFVRALGDGTTQLVQPGGTGEHQILHMAADGSQRRSITGTGDASAAAFDAAGRVSVLAGSNLSQYDVNGQRLYQVDVGITGAASLAGLDDGSVSLSDARGSEAGIWLRAFKPDGSLRWQVALGNTYQNVALLQRDGAVYTLESAPQTGEAGARESSRLSRLSASDGAVQWRHESANPSVSQDHRRGGRLALSHTGNEVLLAHSWGNRLRLQRLDSSNGQLREQRYYACRDNCADPAAFAVDTAGTARIAYLADDENYGQTAAVQAVSHATAEVPRIRLDQPGISGLWYSPYANGEGITFDWIAGPRVLFGAWFTYTASGGNDPARLRWYTIQANDVAVNSNRLELPIADTTGGNFDAGPPASPRIVGKAVLTFTDCDNATLSYDFDADHNDGLDGSITLSRLTPATEACILADGSTRPGAGARPPQNGFDARMSGNWYDESSVGQGLHLNIQPGGLFFSPWFTYDPEGQGNDPDREHWFTLQGNLANAVNGKAEVLIAQSLGGAFDSVPTWNGYAVGKATVSMRDCNHARIEYRFDDDERAGSFRNRRGELELVKIGGCAP